MPVSFVEKPVKSEKKVVDKVQVIKTDGLSFEDFKSYIASLNNGDEVKALAYILDRAVAQHNTDLMNAARAAATGEPTKESLRAQAMTEFAQLSPDEMKQIAGDPTRFAAWQQEKMDSILAKFKADRAFKQSAVAADEGNDD